MNAKSENLLARAMEENRRGRAQRAIALCNVALGSRHSDRDSAAFYLERARANAALSAWAAVEKDCRRTLATEPNATARVLLAQCLRHQSRNELAWAEIESVLAETPSPPAAVWSLAVELLLDLGQRTTALAIARRGRAFGASALATSEFVRALAACGEHAEAIELLNHELTVTPHDASLWNALGMSHYSCGRSQEAEHAFRVAIALRPGFADAHCGLAWVLLRNGDYRDGFAHQEHRLKNAGAERRFGVSPWRGESLADKHIVVCAEQGFGDTIQFARFVPRVRRLAQKTTFVVPRELELLLRTAPSLGDIDARQPAFRGADRIAMLMSLPHLLGTGSDLLVETLPWLCPEPGRVAYWRERLPRGRKIALAWQGNPKYGGEPWRSMPVEHFAPLIREQSANTTFIGVQKHVGVEALRSGSLRECILDLSDEIDRDGAFLDTLAILHVVDQFITTDSAIAHVAGSAGVNAWVLLSQVADWRWSAQGERTPWYPSLRLFRQSPHGGWPEVIARVSRELCA